MFLGNRFPIDWKRQGDVGPPAEVGLGEAEVLHGGGIRDGQPSVEAEDQRPALVLVHVAAACIELAVNVTDPPAGTVVRRRPGVGCQGLFALVIQRGVGGPLLVDDEPARGVVDAPLIRIEHAPAVAEVDAEARLGFVGDADGDVEQAAAVLLVQGPLDVHGRQPPFEQAVPGLVRGRTPRRPSGRPRLRRRRPRLPMPQSARSPTGRFRLCHRVPVPNAPGAARRSVGIWTPSGWSGFPVSGKLRCRLDAIEAWITPGLVRIPLGSGADRVRYRSRLRGAGKACGVS